MMTKKMTGFMLLLMVAYVSKVQGIFKRLKAPLQNQAGATIIEILGYALLAVLAIVLVWGLLSGWLPAFFNKITGKLDSMS
ncbi:hypothetical protein UY286_05130 [Paenibacillus polymyxa]|uniref:hypothetical protein n=1 Tax=Paenibacillus polymyxa TaxID=1406 RepID=UPI002AB346DF|nr:hypothetical protein [Paenibacillus polymyxa]MDY7989822.1 hypothetical protein [Paenibacillus polymyxa]MDY8116819.1 hypothetical protein [Paenibacillus polymyxa]